MKFWAIQFEGTTKASLSRDKRDAELTASMYNREQRTNGWRVLHLNTNKKVDGRKFYIVLIKIDYEFSQYNYEIFGTEEEAEDFIRGRIEKEEEDKKENQSSAGIRIDYEIAEAPLD